MKDQQDNSFYVELYKEGTRYTHYFIIIRNREPVDFYYINTLNYSNEKIEGEIFIYTAPNKYNNPMFDNLVTRSSLLSINEDYTIRHDHSNFCQVHGLQTKMHIYLEGLTILSNRHEYTYNFILSHITGALMNLMSLIDT